MDRNSESSKSILQNNHRLYMDTVREDGRELENMTVKPEFLRELANIGDR